jgi:hypothetical protein
MSLGGYGKSCGGMTQRYWSFDRYMQRARRGRQGQVDACLSARIGPDDSVGQDTGVASKQDAGTFRAATGLGRVKFTDSVSIVPGAVD